MTKINHEEYRILKSLRDSWGWIAKDKNTSLWVYEKEPRKHKDCWDEFMGTCEMIDSPLFQFIQWENDEPYSIDELIREYEDESEEAKVNKQEIIKEYGMSESDWNELIGRYKWHLEQEGYVVIEKPVIPQFVAEFLRGKEEYMLYEFLDIDFIYDEYVGLARWLYNNDEDTNKEREISLVLAQRYGYEVEEEPLYRARLKVITDEFIASYLRTQSSGAEDRLKALEIGSKYIHEDYRHLSEFTEDELKSLDIWGSNQWEIEELEE